MGQLARPRTARLPDAPRFPFGPAEQTPLRSLTFGTLEACLLRVAPDFIAYVERIDGRSSAAFETSVRGSRMSVPLLAVVS